MAVRIAELVGVITADNSNFQRKMAQSEKTAEGTAKSIERSFKGDPFKDFDKNIRKIDKMLDDLEKPRNIGKSLGGKANFREAGRFLEELSRGDAVEALVQLSGSAGEALLGIGAMTKAVLENVREVDQLAREYKLTSIQIQSLQALSDLTGESVKDLAENYKKVAPEAKKLEDLVKSSGAALDDYLRDGANNASLAFEEL